MVSHIAKRELEVRAYTSWLAWFDDNCNEYYIKSPPKEQLTKLRGDTL